jgi:hypothetical protein
MRKLVQQFANHAFALTNQEPPSLLSKRYSSSMTLSNQRRSLRAVIGPKICFIQDRMRCQPDVNKKHARVIALPGAQRPKRFLGVMPGRIRQVVFTGPVKWTAARIAKRDFIRPLRPPTQINFNKRAVKKKSASKSSASTSHFHAARALRRAAAAGLAMQCLRRHTADKTTAVSQSVSQTVVKLLQAYVRFSLFPSATNDRPTAGGLGGVPVRLRRRLHAYSSRIRINCISRLRLKSPGVASRTSVALLQ